MVFLLWQPGQTKKVKDWFEGKLLLFKDESKCTSQNTLETVGSDYNQVTFDFEST